MSKYNSPYIVPVLVLALVFSVVPQIGTAIQLQSNPVAAWWDDLFGGSSETKQTTEISAFSYKAYAKFDGVDGEATDPNHGKWIDVLSFSFGAEARTSGVGPTRRSGDVVIEDITLTKELDKSTPKLQEKCLKGEVIPMLEIEVTSNYGGATATYLRYELKNVIITSFNCNAGSGDESPSDTITINYEEIKGTYTEYDDEGKSKGNVAWEYKLVSMD